MRMPLNTIRAAIIQAEGNLASAARRLRMTRGGVAYRVAKSKLLQELVEDQRQILVDEAESSLRKACKRGDAWAVCFTLKTQGRERGYIERVEHTGGAGGPLEFTFLIQRPALALDIDVTPPLALPGGNGNGNGAGNGHAIGEEQDAGGIAED